mmetsp:Transcript_55902/g.110721  ORF Transcript_55902/g.110721 Transcript_55902/m.110721 type:complete len:238 (-) Transcript_55902:175-888(-)
MTPSSLLLTLAASAIIQSSTSIHLSSTRHITCIDASCLGRRSAINSVAAGFFTLFGGLPTLPALAKCTDIESCREEGDRRFAESELKAGPIVKLGKGVRFRESKVGTGEQSLKEGDVALINYSVLTSGGNYMWSLGRSIEPGQRDEGETLRVTLGNHDVPLAVEMAMLGMKQGGKRNVEMPPALGFSSSGGQPIPSTFSGKKKLERYQALLTGNGLQPGYDAMLNFDLELVKIRPKQ